MTHSTPHTGSGSQQILLRTKLFAPRVRPRAVARPRLVTRMTEGLAGKLTLISAPPGFGKTSLVAEWRSAEAGARVDLAWVSLDEADNDPTRFWTYVIAALETVRPGVGADALSVMHGSARSSVEALLMALINGMTEVQDDFVLALDDYHLIGAEPIHEGIAFLLEHLPPQAHLLLIARADPPLPLARLRARGDLLELRAKDLRFTPDEAAEFLGRVQGLALSGQDLADLTARTEGWVAGLQLVALSLQGLEDVSGFMAELMGSNRFIVDYLTEEVVHRQPAEVQRFLLETSVLERLSGPLCDAVTGRPGSQGLLEMLESGNLFTVAMDGERRWYRYHRLFADMLTARLLEQDPARVTGLYLRASEWYEQQGMMVEAVRAALNGGDHSRAAVLTERVGDELFQRGEIETLSSLIASLPDELVRSSPGLGLFHARALLTRNHVEAFEQRLKAAEAALEAREGERAGEEWVRGRILALKAIQTRLQGDISRSVLVAEQAVELLSTDDLGWRIAATMALAMSRLHSGHTRAAIESLLQVARLSESAGDLYQTALSICVRADLYAAQGDLRRAYETYQSALRLADGRGERLPCSGWALVGMAGLHLEWNELDEAHRLIMDGIERGRRNRHMDTLMRAYPVAARILEARGEAALDHPALAGIEQVLSSPLAVIREGLDAHRARIHLREGNLEEAIRLGRDVGRDLFLTGMFEPTVRARVTAADGRPREAVAILDEQLGAYEQAECMGLAVRVLTARAMVQSEGDHEGAVETLERAMTLGETAGFFRSFIEEGAPMVPLLRTAARRTAAPEFARRLLAAMGEEPDRPAPALQQPLVEPLSDREMEVLQLVADGLSNQEIADRAFIAVGTVKRHLHNILAKLEARDRKEALARARELGLLG